MTQAVKTLSVQGGAPLAGAVKVEGCKISAVTILVSALLTDEPVILREAPGLLDIELLITALEALGAEVDRSDDHLTIRCRDVDPEAHLPARVFDDIHGSFYLLPALLARCGRASVRVTTGGCNIGIRPVDHMIYVLREMGATISTDGALRAEAGGSRLRGTRIDLHEKYGPDNNKYISGATKVAILAGVLADGETVIEGAYWRAPIVNLCAFLRSMGATIEGDGTRTIRVQGSAGLGGTDFRIPHDRLVLGTYFAAAGITGGEIRCEGAGTGGMEDEIAAFERMGLRVTAHGTSALTAVGPAQLQATDISTEVIDTDLGPLFASLMTLAAGKSRVEEVVWERRFNYASELEKMGARVAVDGNVLHLAGVDELRGADVRAHDLRAGAALLIAAMAARGASRVDGLGHLERGYEDLPGRLAALGARIEPLQLHTSTAKG